MSYDQIKPETIRSIRQYVDRHQPTGDFLLAVLTNDLKEACFRADDDNITVLPEIVCYCYNEIPSVCWGSPERVARWLQDADDHIEDGREMIAEYERQKGGDYGCQ